MLLALNNQLFRLANPASYLKPLGSYENYRGCVLSRNATSARWSAANLEIYLVLDSLFEEYTCSEWWKLHYIWHSVMWCNAVN